MKARGSTSPETPVITAPETLAGLLEAGAASGTVVRGLIAAFFIVPYWRLLGLEARRRPRV